MMCSKKIWVDTLPLKEYVARRRAIGVWMRANGIRVIHRRDPNRVYRLWNSNGWWLQAAMPLADTTIWESIFTDGSSREVREKETDDPERGVWDNTSWTLVSAAKWAVIETRTFYDGGVRRELYTLEDPVSLKLTGF